MARLDHWQIDYIPPHPIDLQPEGVLAAAHFKADLVVCSTHKDRLAYHHAEIDRRREEFRAKRKALLVEMENTPECLAIRTLKDRLAKVRQAEIDAQARKGELQGELLKALYREQPVAEIEGQIEEADREVIRAKMTAALIQTELSRNAERITQMPRAMESLL